MTGQEFKILFKEDRAFLTQEKALTLSQVDIPKIVKSFKPSAFWTIRVLKYQEAEAKLICEVLTYQIGETSFPPNQKSFADKLKTVESVTFRNIDTDGLFKTIASTTPIVKQLEENPVSEAKEFIDVLPVQITQPIRRTLSETFLIPLKDVRFKFGGVAFEKKFRGYSRSVQITIENHEIREEFDAVKNYFANILQTKKIHVTATIQIENHVIQSLHARSPDIDKIDKSLIDNVKFEYVKGIKKKLSVEIDKSLFTSDEFFDAFGEEKSRGNVFSSNEKELFEDILQISNSKHYKHLRFLSSQHLYQKMKLRFVHKPFSFIFLLEGERNYHLVWETLDTEEATYLWHIDKNLQMVKERLRKIEDIINVIKVQGKTAYINSTEDRFRRIYHDYSNLVDGFIKWKGELESVLT